MARRNLEGAVARHYVVDVLSAHASISAYALAAVAICVISQVGCARRAELQRPPRVSFAPLPVSDVEAAIYEGCNRRKWIPSKVRDGEIEATLYLRSHVAVVDIDYDADSFQVHYVRSENLNYKNRNGEELIHPNYNAWVKNLISDIDAALSQRRAPAAIRSAR